MNRTAGVLKSQYARLRTWIAGHFTETTTIVVGILIVAYKFGPSLLNRPVHGPDPQEQIGIKWLKTSQAADSYAGNDACKSCHAKEFATYSQSPHSHSVTEIPPGLLRAEFSKPAGVADDGNSVAYTVKQTNGQNIVVATTATDTQEGVARWVFGSGQQAYTYLAQDGNKFTQLRLTYYPPSGEWNFTPGSGPSTPFHGALGDPYTAAQAAACFGCHTTALVGTSKSIDFAHSRLNVGCESCHGPSKAHVLSMSVSAENPVIPTHNTPREVLQLCGTCHRVPGASGSTSGAPESQLARFPGVALPRSKCFTASAGKLTCTTCHNPHVSLAKQGETSFERACASCHNSSTGTVCTHGDMTGCIGCHMPAQKIGAKLPMMFHNHWIRILQEQTDPTQQ